MKRIWNYLRSLWGYREPDPLAYCRTGNAKDNELLDEWLKEHKGRPITPEAFEEYRRKVLESVEKKSPSVSPRRWPKS
jgi:hypothetical protein